VRFADPVMPGETLIIELWKESELRVIARASVKERDKVVLSNAAVEFYAEIPKPKAAKPAAKAEGEKKPAAAQAGTPEVFGAIAAYVAKHPELTKTVGCVFQFNIKNPDSAWVLDLKNGAGEVKGGTADKADTTLELSDADWLAMSSGKADPMKLFTSKKLKITGNVMASQKLEFLKKIDPKDVAAPAAAPAQAQASSAPAAEPVGPRVLKALEALVKKNPALAKDVGATIQVKVTSPDLAFVLDFAKGATVKAGTVKDAATTLTLSDEALAALAKGESTLESLFQHGAARIDGDVLVAHRLGLFKQLL